MELRRIVINKEITMQKLSSNKNITKEIPETDKTDCLTNKGEEQSFCESVTECPNPLDENVIHHKKDSNQIDQNENNINKQLTEIRHNKQKLFTEQNLRKK